MLVSPGETISCIVKALCIKGAKYFAGKLRKKEVQKEVMHVSTNFFLRSSRIGVDLLSYESKTTDKREQYDWMVEKNLDVYSSR